MLKMVLLEVDKESTDLAMKHVYYKFRVRNWGLT